MARYFNSGVLSAACRPGFLAMSGPKRGAAL